MSIFQNRMARIRIWRNGIWDVEIPWEEFHVPHPFLCGIRIHMNSAREVIMHYYLFYILREGFFEKELFYCPIPRESLCVT